MPNHSHADGHYTAVNSGFNSSGPGFTSFGSDFLK